MPRSVPATLCDIAAVPQPLPIDAGLDEILTRLRERGTVIVSAPPGAGKTTRLPLALLRAGLLERGALWLLQPRRVATRAAARRLADELGERVGQTVGYVIRDEAKRSPATRILVVTEGILTRRLLSDPSLEGVAAVMLDEFHERSRHTDLALALLHDVRQTLREDLLLIVASATLDAGPVSRYLSAPVVTVPGGLFAVDVVHADRVDDRPLPARAAQAVARALAETPRGDVLVFLPGAREIRETGERLAALEVPGLLVVPLHGDLAADAQDRALAPAPPGSRKVILSTNVAETSLTIEGVSVVVDGGQARVLRFDPRSGLNRLVLSRISRASATQRSGRAGRLGPGVAHRLYTKEEERGMPPFEEPELQRTELSSTLLDVLSWQAKAPETFPWFEAPPAALLARALALLRHLGAVAGFEPTAMGRALAALPVAPRLGTILVAGRERGFGREAALLAALLEERDVLTSSRAFGGGAAANRSGTVSAAFDEASGASELLRRYDLIVEAERGGLRDGTLLALGLDRGAVRAVLRLRDRLAGDGASRAAPSEADLLRLVLAGFPDRVARRRAAGSDEFVLVGGRTLKLDRQSVVRDAELVVVLATSGGDGVPERIRLASAVERDWLAALPGSPLATETVRVWDEAREMVVAERRTVYEGLTLSEQEIPAPLDDETAELLWQNARRDLSRAFDFGRDATSLLARLRLLARALPEAGIQTLDGAPLERLLEARVAGKRRLTELRSISVADAIRDGLDFETRRLLDREAPVSLKVPTGRAVTLAYDEGDGPPVLAVKLQELFGLAETPRVARGRVPLLLHLLSPAGRPVQVTQDLASFWNGTYQTVRKELRGRYPRHPWPEDPWNAPPQRGTKRSGR